MISGKEKLTNIRDNRSAEYQILRDVLPEHSESENHSHAWRGTWERPVNVDETYQHPFTIARMTDHNVRGSDEK